MISLLSCPVRCSCNTPVDKIYCQRSRNKICKILLTNRFRRHNIEYNNQTGLLKPVSKSSRRSVRRSQRAADGGIAAAAATLNGLTRAIRGRNSAVRCDGNFTRYHGSVHHGCTEKVHLSQTDEFGWYRRSERLLSQAIGARAFFVV